MKVLAVIPARGGSKGVPRKNVRPLAGRPLLAWAVEAALACPAFGRVVVSTDDEEIAAAARAAGAEIPFLRPAGISHDKASLESVGRHALEFFEAKGEAYDAVLSLQPTNPFIRPETLAEAVRLMDVHRPDSVTAVAEITQGHPWIAKRLGPEGQLSDFCAIPPGTVRTPRQAREKAYYLTGAIYLRSIALLKNGASDSHCLGERSIGVLLDAIEAQDINSELDFRFCEFIAAGGMRA